MNYPMYNFQNPTYLNDLQQMRDRIDKQMQQVQQYQTPQPTAINQTFQLAPQSNINELDGKYAKDIEDVKNTLALKDTLFIDKENTLLWIKKADGTIKTFTLTEVIELDEKDKEIMELKKEIEEMKGMILNAKSNSNDDININESTTNKKSSNGTNTKASSK